MQLFFVSRRPHLGSNRASQRVGNSVPEAVKHQNINVLNSNEPVEILYSFEILVTTKILLQELQ